MARLLLELQERHFPLLLGRGGVVILLRNLACFGVTLVALCAAMPLSAGPLDSSTDIHSTARSAPTFPMSFSRHGEVIIATGEIQPDSVTHLLALWTSGGRTAQTILFESPGGHLAGALSLGRVIRSLGLETVVASAAEKSSRRPAQCQSACVYAFAGGIRRSIVPGSLLGVHQFYMAQAADGERKPRQQYSSADFSAMQQTLASLASYLVEMGVDLALLDWAVETEPTAMRRLSPSDLTKVRLVQATGTFAKPAQAGTAPAPAPLPHRKAAIETRSPTASADPAWPVVMREGSPWIVLTAPGQSRRFGAIFNEVAIGCPQDGSSFAASFREIVPIRSVSQEMKAVILPPSAHEETLLQQRLPGELRGAITRETVLQADRVGALEIEVTSSATASYPMRIAFPGAGLEQGLRSLEKACHAEAHERSVHAR